MQKYIDDYLASVNNCLSSVPKADIEALVEKLLEAYEQESTIFIAGNGGSASTANHFACDLSKTILGEQPRKQKKRLKAFSLSDSIAILTAWANDEGYEHIFSEQLKSLAKPGDLLIVITASGSSPNIIKVVETARELDLNTYGLLGFGGGKVKSLLKDALVVDSYDYGYVEGVHSVLSHLVSSLLTKILNLNGDRSEK